MTSIFSKGILEIHGYTIQLWLFIVLFLLLWNMETLVTLIRRDTWKRMQTNAPFVIANIPNQLVMTFLFAGVIHFDAQYQLGFLNRMPVADHPWLAFGLSFLFLDLGEYTYHVVMHKKRWLWIFHAVHHSDEYMDASTTLREHPGENFIRQSFTLIWVFLSGTAFWMLMLRQIIQVFSTLLAHTSIRLPDKLDRIISLVFITPNLHHVHHHYKQPYTDSNYGDVLSIWDRIFGTFRRLPAGNISFGVDTLQEAETDKFPVLLKLPFSSSVEPMPAADAVISQKEFIVRENGNQYRLAPDLERESMMN